jgi:hypothetical protein
MVETLGGAAADAAATVLPLAQEPPRQFIGPVWVLALDGFGGARPVLIRHRPRPAGHGQLLVVLAEVILLQRVDVGVLKDLGSCRVS